MAAIRTVAVKLQDTRRPTRRWIGGCRVEKRFAVEYLGVRSPDIMPQAKIQRQFAGYFEVILNPPGEIAEASACFRHGILNHVRTVHRTQEETGVRIASSCT